jgi:hypothetical protein
MTKIYLAGAPDDEDFAPVARALRERDWNVRNSPADLAKDLRHQAKLLLDCDAVCFLFTWWTSEQANALQMIAGWTRTKVIHPETFEVLADARP